MARDQPVTDDEIEAVREGIREQREDVREYLESEGVDLSDLESSPTETVSKADRETADSD